MNQRSRVATQVKQKNVMTRRNSNSNHKVQQMIADIICWQMMSMDFTCTGVFYLVFQPLSCFGLQTFLHKVKLLVRSLKGGFKVLIAHIMCSLGGVIVCSLYSHKTSTKMFFLFSGSVFSHLGLYSIIMQPWRDKEDICFTFQKS